MIREIEGKLKWFLLLLPGFLSFALAGYLADMGTFSEFEFTTYSLALSLVNVTISLIMFYVVRWLLGHIGATAESNLATGIFAILLLIVSCLTGVVTALAYERDIALRWIREAPTARLMTKRSSQRPLTFLLSQNRRGKLEEGRPPSMKVTEAWVEVHLTNGEVFQGYPEYFSLGNEPGEIFLSPACRRIRSCGKAKTEPLPGPGVLIYERDIRTIEFVDRPKSECHELWKKVQTSQSREAPGTLGRAANRGALEDIDAVSATRK